MKQLFLLLLVFLTGFSKANKTAAELYLELQKLHGLNRVLYIAAHPDDENTRALAWFSLGKKAETAYLSLTRGDGGQNLIGDELSEYLGVLRTQELLAARSFDGARQYFSRAVDFGYSKSAKETLEKWGKDEILYDVVLTIRKFKPDVIVTRFPPDTRGGHGHHTASAMLAIEGFEKAADPNFLPELVEEFGTWQADAIYWNTSYWWNRDIADSAKAHPEKYLVKDIGGYNSLLGMSYNEIGTIARSQHKCQGFGAIIERGSRVEYFEYLAGKHLETSFFEESTRSWESLGNAQLEDKFQALLQNFDFTSPSHNVYPLFDIYKELGKLEPSTIKDEKLARCESLIINCLGLHLEAVSSDFAYTVGADLAVTIEALNRSEVEVKLETVKLGDSELKVNQALIQNKPTDYEIKTIVNNDYSGPYWLQEPFENLFRVPNKRMLGKPDSDPSFTVLATLKIAGKSIEVSLPVTYKWRDPSFGEKKRPTLVTPRFTANFEQDIALLKKHDKKMIRFQLHSFVDSLDEKIKIKAPEGWKVDPEIIPVKMGAKHEEKWFSFELKPTRKSIDGPLVLKDKKGNVVYNYREIVYDHIPTQAVMRQSSMRCLQLDAEIEEGKIAYIKGVKDAVPDAIRQLGFEVKEYEVADLSTVDLSEFRSVVLGIRIYNVHPELHNFSAKLHQYVENGGNLIMQYNTASRRSNGETFGPVPFELSRNRVTEEDAAVTILKPEHPIFMSPNQITQEDFNGWVQERGLYFADNWSAEYTPLLSWHDEGEDPQEGGLIVTQYGKGQFVYTGISFFRELPNGVIGAYRLFANLLSYPND